MEMTDLFNAFGAWLEDVAPWLIGASVVVEIAPLKINPWSRLLRWIGKVSLGDRLDKLEKDVNDVRTSVEERAAKDARAAILHFADSLVFYPDRKHSKDRFDEVVQYITEYDKYCEKHPDFPNHMTESSAKLILDEYNRRMADHDFL